MFRGKVMRWSMDKGLETIIDANSGAPVMPGGLGWLTNGELIVVDCNERKLIKRSISGELSVYADLSNLTNFLLNDMFIDGFGVAWVGGHGFDPESTARTASPIYKVKSGTDIQPTAVKFVFPNGCDQYQDKFAVAETFADQISYLDLDGNFIKKFNLPEGSGPDGISFDGQGRLFIAAAFSGTLDFINERDELINFFRFQSSTNLDGSEPSRGIYDCAANSELGIIAFASASSDEKYAMGHDTGAISFMKLP
jgi:sugar lactone lactonase YvrE